MGGGGKKMKRKKKKEKKKKRGTGTEGERKKIEKSWYFRSCEKNKYIKM